MLRGFHYDLANKPNKVVNMKRYDLPIPLS